MIARKLKVDLDELTYAFENASWETSQFLDLETGQIILIMDETRSHLESINEEHWDEAIGEIDLQTILETLEIHEWQKEAMLDAERVEIGFGERYITIPKDDARDGYRDMRAYFGTVRDERLSRQLLNAIEGRKPFRAFKDQCFEHSAESNRWLEFKQKRVRERVIGWLNTHGIDPIIEPMTDFIQTQISERIRTVMMAEVLSFVSAGHKIPGIIRIALIGSLATDKPEPKDVDLLVTVTDEADLAPLAEVARKLNGHLQSRNRGGEVFLMNPAGEYIGRTCPWKRCGPGIRASCDAQNCGQRQYLHDDLQDVHLRKELIAEPPIELWPHVFTRIQPPEDIREGLLEPSKNS